jgi:prephenate dehydrogenase
VSDGDLSTFEYFSSEYAQALDAYRTIEQQAATIAILGASDELLQFIDRFIDMASRTKAAAEDRNEPHFAEWFGELIEKAEALRGAVRR